jgi:hypothetical protein
MDNPTLKEIYLAFDGKLVGSYQMRTHVCQVVALLPDDIRDDVTRMCWFMGSMEDAWAFTFTGNDLRDQHLIFLSDELLLQNVEQIHYSIAHEIGHVILGHRNSVLDRQSKEEIDKQEKEADTFAKQFVSI